MITNSHKMPTWSVTLLQSHWLLIAHIAEYQLNSFTVSCCCAAAVNHGKKSYWSPVLSPPLPNGLQSAEYQFGHCELVPCQMPSMVDSQKAHWLPARQLQVTS
jgi:hypothetical protein